MGIFPPKRRPECLIQHCHKLCFICRKYIIFYMTVLKRAVDIKLSCICVDLNTQLINVQLVNFVLQTIAVIKEQLIKLQLVKEL